MSRKVYYLTQVSACVISIIIISNAISIISDVTVSRSCTPKQIGLQVILLLQLLYCVSVLLLTSRYKSAAAQYKTWHYYLAPPPSILTKQI